MDDRWRVSIIVLAGAAITAAARKHVKYDAISATHIFVPVHVALETLEHFCDEGTVASDIGLRPCKIYNDTFFENLISFSRVFKF